MSLQQTAKIIFQGEDNVSRVMVGIGGHLDNFQNSLSGFNSAVGDVTEPFANLAEGVLKADAALTALAVGGLTYAFKKSMDFQTASIELQKVIGDEISLMDDATGQARALSLEYGESATEILASTANFKQAGFNVQEAMQLTKDALDLVIAGDIDAAQASEILIAALKGFREPATEATRLVNILNEVSNQYATDVEQLGIGMAALSPIAFQMGFSMEETAGVLTPVIEIFRSGDEAAIALKTGLLKLIDDTKPVRAALESIGVAQFDANGQLRSGKDILFDVASAFQHLDQNQKLFVTQQLVGIDQSARMVEVFDNLAKSSEITATAMGAAGSAAGEVATRLASSEIAVKRFVATFEGMAITIGDEFREAATGAINGGSEILAALNNVVASGALDPLFETLEQGLNELGAFLSDVAAALPEAFERVNFDELLQALRGLGLEIGGLFDGIDLTTPEGLAEAIQLVVDSITGLVNVTSGMVQGAKPFLETLLDMAQGFAEMDAESQQASGSALGFMGAINKLTGPIGQVLSAIEGISGALYSLAGVSVVRAVAGLIGTGGLTSAFGSVAAGAGSLVTALTSPAGLLAVTAALAGTEVVRAVQAFNSWQDAEEELEGSLKRGATATELLKTKYAEIGLQTGYLITSTEQFHELVNSGTIGLNKQTGQWENLAGAQRDYLGEVKAAQQSGESWNDTLGRITDSQGNLIGAVDSATAALDSNKEEAIALQAAYYEMRGNSPEIARAMAEIEKGVTKTGDAEKKTAEETEKLKQTMLELASEERIKKMQFTAEINLAKLEGETKIATQIIDNLGEEIKSTGDLVGDLFGNLLDADNFQDRWLIEEMIEEENKRREEAFEQQKKLTDAQIALIEERVRAMREGEALINIKLEGVEPELESILWKIMERVQMRVNEEASELLIGLGAMA